jgi:hypothetical protein
LPLSFTSCTSASIDLVSVTSTLHSAVGVYM